jgi:hypothetical protein
MKNTAIKATKIKPMMMKYRGPPILYPFFFSRGKRGNVHGQIHILSDLEPRTR